ncbi:hypothetical protein NSK_005189 [Nannochloropsis salina CCMP1776]|uniref:Amine oxidase n=1 Tax=Nannochloropsis salina CCMP1776 TaxID=1027361 RepID=A0A4D9CZ94_9STRA|nr:hypothetical protein NSK_005189 [Nannochloropsis salina CCMP1776]|eukprot:TFJ83507.1 hypothetical protein NSK_005189 [Nannochloropsis salina CCMP1776]
MGREEHKKKAIIRKTIAPARLQAAVNRKNSTDMPLGNEKDRLKGRFTSTSVSTEAAMSTAIKVAAVNTLTSGISKGKMGGPSNPHHNAWTIQERLLTSELQAQRDADLAKERFWVVESSGAKNRTGKPTAYKLVARDPIHIMARDQAAFLRRAGYTKHTLWVTAYQPQERFPGGEFPNQDPRPLCGLPLYAAKDRPLVDKDVVLWHVFGAHHVPRLEDWPVMPFEKVSCVFKPFGFFDASPVLDVPVATKRQMLLSTSNRHVHTAPTPRGNHHKRQSFPDLSLGPQSRL